ncbi:hypothetical protein H0H93_004434 [Arthromyces matolae]|nr:hypothetical protein H0H93_004434 [Arthromyces matolae]
MEHGTTIDKTRDELAAKNRFESFKLGKGLSSTVAQKKHSHTRSHSRNNSSISLSLSMPSKSVNVADASAPTSPNPPSKRNSHHRRLSSVSTRIESAELMGVSIPDLPPSTSEDNVNLGEKDSIRRRALWALEGKPDVAYSKVEIPELSTPVMEKVMFDFATKASQPQNPIPSYGVSINMLMANKRDSFKLLGASSSSKDQLHTLVEEEEEEEQEEEKESTESHDAEPQLTAPEPPVVDVMTKTSVARPRPATLNLRPLSLTPDALVNITTGLPTPAVSPSPRVGLKTLALVPSDDDHTNIMTKRLPVSSSPLPHRPPLTLNLASETASCSSTAVEDGKNRRSSISYRSSSKESITTNYGLPTPDTATYPSFEIRTPPVRRRSGSSNGTASVEEDLSSPKLTHSRPLSASEQHFLFKSHNALLTRIQDLERALSTRRMSSGTASNSNTGSSRPVSLASDFSSSDFGIPGEPSDEMFKLVADLKAERDDLKKDVDGWRTRVADLEKQLTVLAGRVDSERRDAWVARSMSGLLEIEKKTLEGKLASLEKTMLGLETEKQVLQSENIDAKDRITALESELERVRGELQEERDCKQVESDLVQNETPVTPTPRAPESRPRPVGFIAKRITSVDSDVTEVEESLEDSPKFNFPLKSVTEDEEEDLSEEDNGLAGYEDEEESDVAFQSSSSFGSEEEMPRSVAHLQDVPDSVTPRSTSPPVIHAPRPTHANRASLSKTWTFPTAPSRKLLEEPEVDKFFGCLEDDDDSDGSVLNSPSAYSYERSKNLFASGFKNSVGEDDSPFFFPFGHGNEVESRKTLDVVEEEDTESQEDEDMFGEAGGIQITFTPPDADEDESDVESPRSPSPAPVTPSIPTINFFDFDEEQETSAPFNFGRPAVPAKEEDQVNTEAHVSPPRLGAFKFGQSTSNTVVKADLPTTSSMITPPPSLPRHAQTAYSPPTPSSIPRATFIKPLSLSLSDSTASTFPKPGSSRAVSDPIDSNSVYITPPSKRGGNMPSFIPQAVSSPSPLRSVSNGSKSRAGALPSSTFIRQPERKPLTLANSTKSHTNSSGPSNGSTFAPQIPNMLNDIMNTRFILRSPDLHSASASQGTHSEMKTTHSSSDHFVLNTTKISSSTTPSQTYPSISQNRNTSFAPRHPSEMPSSLSSSISSIMTSPLSSRISFESFTNFIPFSWSQRNIASGAPTTHVSDSVQADDDVPSSREVFQAPAVAPVKRGFVSKEKQLEKLRSRLKQENLAKADVSFSAGCKKCDIHRDIVL